MTEPDSLILHKLNELTDEVKLLNKYLTGNGDPQSGLIVRVDRLEQSEERRKWLIRVAVGASIGACITSLKTWMSS